MKSQQELEYVTSLLPDGVYWGEGITGEIVLEIARRALTAASESGAKSVAYIAGADEYGPKLLWKKHWVDLIGQSLYTSPVTSPDDTAHLLSTEANAARLRSSIADYAALHLTPEQALADAKGAE